MKVNRLTWWLLFSSLIVAVAQQPALTSETNSTSTNLWGDPVVGETEAVEETRIKAENGDVRAQAVLGFSYLTGKGVPQSLSDAAKWLQKAAENGDAGAQHNLGYMCGKGIGVEKDTAGAFKWYLKAAEQGFPASQFEVGSYYFNGTGVQRNYEHAAKWLQKAAVQGDGWAQNNLAVCYQEGKGVLQDYVEAYKWYNLAAAKGVESATINRQSVSDSMTVQQIAEAQRLAREFIQYKKPHNVSGPRKVSTDSPLRASGTGFLISDDGFLISNAHVVEGAAKVRLVTSAGLISARVVKVDAANDLALLKAEGRFAALPVAASRGVKLGGTVATVGFPNIGLQGFSPKLAKGEVASLSGAGDDARYFQISVPMQPGNSGGALVDERGNVVGVVSAKLSARAALAASGVLPENVNYAVKSSYLLSFLESVPEVASKLKEPSVQDKKFEEVVKEAEQAAVLVLVY